MNDPFQLVTNCAFKGKDYLVQMCVINKKKLELLVTDKLMAEDWQCEYDAPYIEALTHKTGNFKNFEVFIMMLKSGLLKTSDCITLDLLTVEDLEELRNKKMTNSHRGSKIPHSGYINKRYLILTYTAEFDRIHYPLPLDYCGPPDPTILQSNIRRLEAEVQRLKQNNPSILNRDEIVETRKLKERIEHLSEDNNFLSSEVRRLNKVLSKTTKPIRRNLILQNTLRNLEEQVLQEKNRFHRTIWKLREENRHLKQQIEELKTSEKCLKLRLRNASKNSLQSKVKKTVPDSQSPEQCLDRRRKLRGDQSESQLTCRAITSWNSTALSRPRETNNMKKRSDMKTRSRSSSESGKSDKIVLTERKVHLREKPLARNYMKAPSSRKSSSECSRRSSFEKMTNVETEIIKPVSRKSRLCKEKRDTSIGSEARSGRNSRESSISSTRSTKHSRTSSKHSRNSQYTSHESGDQNLSKRKKTKVMLPDRDELKFSVSDLESRIHALQKLLSEGLNF